MVFDLYRSSRVPARDRRLGRLSTPQGVYLRMLFAQINHKKTLFISRLPIIFYLLLTLYKCEKRLGPMVFDLYRSSRVPARDGRPGRLSTPQVVYLRMLFAQINHKKTLFISRLPIISYPLLMLYKIIVHDLKRIFQYAEIPFCSLYPG